jgi:hypothetical protein
LAKFQRDNITSFSFDENKVKISPWELLNENRSQSDFLAFPLFPNLKRLKYMGVKDRCTANVNAFTKLFIIGCQLTHFELSYGFEPICPGKKFKGDKLFVSRLAKAKATNYSYRMVRKEVFVALRTSSYTSLEIFIDHDPLSYTFTNEIGGFYEPYDRIPLPFENLQILVFNCKDLNVLTHQAIPQCYQDCHPTTWHDHSIWRHVSSLFPNTANI